MSTHTKRGLIASRPVVRMVLGVAVFCGQLISGVVTAHASVVTHTVHRAAMLPQPCSPAAGCTQAPVSAPTLSLPAGDRQCSASGPATACWAADGRAVQAPGQASTPSGAVACGIDAANPVPFGVAACSDEPPGLAASTASAAPPVTLTSDQSVVAAGTPVVLTATAAQSVSGTRTAIEIFDLTSRTLLAACGEKSTCAVADTLNGGDHKFIAFVTSSGSESPAGSLAVSNTVEVGWLATGITATGLLAPPGQKVTVTATSTVNVDSFARRLEILDASTGSQLTYCTHGNACATTISEPAGGVENLVAHVTGTPDAMSLPIRITWLGVGLSASTLTSSTSGTVYLQATVNADLTPTPWQLAIYDDHMHLIGHVCRTGSTCGATTWVAAGSATPAYTAVLSAGSGTNVVAESAPVTPSRLLWGVDSCKSSTADPAGVTGLYPRVAQSLGAPDFWGRYLTDTGCPGISQAEVAAAHYHHLGILPIYNDYDCSAVNGYQAGFAYATAAAAAATNLGIPQGRGLAIDIEPPGAQCPGAGSVDAAFIEGWYDGVVDDGYAPVYYGNGTAGSEFASAWCTAVADRSGLGGNSYLWSFEPSLQANFTRASEPGYAPYQPGCGGNMVAWQYQIDGLGGDVDQDVALSMLPLWFP